MLLAMPERNLIILDSLHLIGFKIQESERNIFGFKGNTLVYALSSDWWFSVSIVYCT
jgi:hypothetical protein